MPTTRSFPDVTHPSDRAIRIDEVTHRYGRDDGEPITVLREISLSLDKGEFVAVVGPSGCGKTTLLRLVAGLAAPTSGIIKVHGETVTGPREDVSFIFQDAVMLPWFNILDNVTLPLRIRGEDMGAARRRGLDMLAQVGLGDFSRAFPSQLSGGMRQRAAIVRALITDPSVLLMDEPFGALDALTRSQMNVELAGVAERSGCSVLLITHSISEAIFLADRVVVMTPRPGSIAEIVDIGLDRPRTRSAQHDPLFLQLEEKVRAHFDH